jgi:hypothetical protein
MLAFTDVIVQQQRLELRHNADRIDSRMYAVCEWKIDNPELSAERDGRFCYLLRQRFKAGTSSAGKQHRYAFFTSH